MTTNVLAFGVLPANGENQIALPTQDGYHVVNQADYERILGVLAYYGIGSCCNLSPVGIVGYETAQAAFCTEMALFEQALDDVRSGKVQPIVTMDNEQLVEIENEHIGQYEYEHRAEM